MDKRFKKLEEEYFRLKNKLTTGRITREQFDAAMKELMIEDALGLYWTIGADSGRWHVRDGESWVEANPSGVRAKTTEAQPRFSPALTSATRLISFLALGCGTLLCLILLVGMAWVSGPAIVKTALGVGAKATPTASARTKETPGAGLSMGPITCSSGFDETAQRPIGARPDKIILLGAKRLYVSWPYRGVDPNDSYVYYWQYSGQQWMAGIHKFPNSSGIAWTFTSSPDGQPLAPGTYRFEIRSSLQTTIAAEECIIILSDR